MALWQVLPQPALSLYWSTWSDGLRYETLQRILPVLGYCWKKEPMVHWSELCSGPLHAASNSETPAWASEAVGSPSGVATRVWGAAVVRWRK